MSIKVLIRKTKQFYCNLYTLCSSINEIQFNSIYNTNLSKILIRQNGTFFSINLK